MSLVSSLSIAQQALAVNQAAISVVSNNIANVDNENYSKLNVNLADVVNYTKLTGSATAQSNTLCGVQLQKITRLSDEYLESYFRGENSTYSYLEEYSTVANSVEDVMNELNDTGLNTALSNFYDAVNALENSPTDITARQNYVSCAKNVCSVFNGVYKSLTSTQQSLVGDYTVNGSVDSSEIGTDITEINSLLDQLSEVNGNIVKTNSTNTSSSSLLDQRDSILKSLSGYIPVKTTLCDNGTVNVSIGGHDLVNGPSVTGHLDATTGPSASNPVTINIVDPNNNSTLYSNVNSDLSSGTIGAILDVTGSATSSNFTINSAISSIDKLANAFATEINKIQAGTITSGGTTTYAMCLSSDYKTLTASAATNNLFINKDSGLADANINAGNISINSNIESHLYLVAAGRSTTGVDSTDVGNKQNANMLNATQNATYSEIGNQTFVNYLSTEVSSIGTSVKGIDNNLDTQSSVISSIESQLSSKTGVNLDEELGDLIKYQQAYQAAARMFSICSDLLGELIHLGE